ncbi:GATA transcription factor 1 [Trifolium pratense]|nr:GATA transcription factor 1 [Trifolium pratense]XP_045805391.1 GATA transcription factor 1 [Trifolium pratense]XP_045805463.1 GATA transcription factor 1 [Trifolium pratense]
MDGLSIVDDLLDFSSDIGEDDDDDKSKKSVPSLKPKCSDPPSLSPLGLDDANHSFPEYAEEELEWLSNKDAFPAVETFVDISCIQPDMSKYQKTTPTLENSTSSSNNSNNSSNSITLLSGYNQMKFPVRARSKSRSKPRLDTLNQQFPWKQPSTKISREQVRPTSNIERKCHHCGADNTPQWRAGPNGPKTLCNACGVRYKSGRLVPEYRPANSPTFRRDVHSNSHRKVLEMRRQKGMG